MSAIVTHNIEQYIAAHTSGEDKVLSALNRRTHTDVMMPQMLSGQVQGQFLQMMTAILQPMRILEIGTFTGYTAICFAKHLPKDGLLYTIEVNIELEPIISEYLQDAGVTDKVKLHFGNALDIIPTLDEAFDLVFIDADKVNYSQYYDMVIDKVRHGGIILADNVLWSGKIVEDKKDKDTLALDAFNKKIQEDPRVSNVMLSIRDGIMMIRKL